MAPVRRGAARRCTPRARSPSFPAIGYDHPDQSHFTCRHFWEVGELDTGGSSGWLGRYLDLYGDADNPLQGLSLNG